MHLICLSSQNYSQHKRFDVSRKKPKHFQVCSFVNVVSISWQRAEKNVYHVRKQQVAKASLSFTLVDFVKNGFLFSSSLYFKENQKSYEDGRGAYLQHEEFDLLVNLHALILQDRLKMMAGWYAFKTLKKAHASSRGNNE